MARKSKVGGVAGNIVRIVLIVLLLFGLLAAIGFVWKFTDGGNSGFTTFYLTYEGDDILDRESEILKK